MPVERVLPQSRGKMMVACPELMAMEMEKGRWIQQIF